MSSKMTTSKTRDKELLEKREVIQKMESLNLKTKTAVP